MADPGKPVAPGDVEKGGSMIYNSTEEKVPLVPPVDPQAKGKRKSNIILILAGLLVVAISTTIVFVVDATKSDDDDSDEMVEDLESDLEELENNKFFTESQLAFFGGLQLSPLPTRFPEEPFILALQKIDFEEVKKDISAMLVDSQDFWPADYGTYGAFFIHLAWHCSATYRTFDGRGGCEGGRPRFEPERSMGENVNKDKAWVLLKKIKDKYGRGLSWGDLIILTANVAIHDLGGPVLGFCAGRIDVKSSYRDHILTDRGLIPIVDQPGTLPQLDPQLLGPICVNAEGTNGTNNPANSTEEIRIQFAVKGFNDSETVALVGGGHSFGKTHGACPLGFGSLPNEDPANSFEGECGTGIASDIYTSGFEGPWTTKPTEFDNEYFMNLVNFDWVQETSTGGLTQWGVVGKGGPRAPTPFQDNSTDFVDSQQIMMLTTDVAWLADSSYRQIVQKFAFDLQAFSTTFENVWFKLTTQDMGYNRCFDTGDLPPVQDFQHPLPAPPLNPPPKEAVEAAIDALFMNAGPQVEVEGWKPLMVTFAYNCAQTWRVTDHSGGCNGARIRFSPGKDWRANAGVVDEGMAILQPVKEKFGDNLTWADLIVQAGTYVLTNGINKPNTNVLNADVPSIPFCPGRSDDTDGLDWVNLEPIVFGDFSDDIVGLKDYWRRSGLNFRDMVALEGRLRSPDQQRAMGYAGSWANDTFAKSGTLSNEYFRVLTSEEWEVFELDGVFDTQTQFKAKGKNIFMKKSDLLLLEDGTQVPQDGITNESDDLRSIVADFAFDNSLFLEHFALSWKKLMNADRMNGPTSNLCADVA